MQYSSQIMRLGYLLFILFIKYKYIFIFIILTKQRLDKMELIYEDHDDFDNICITKLIVWKTKNKY